jgi:hypothetical protein
MNYAIHRISIDVTDDSPSQLTISAKQGDTAKILIISLLDDKKNYQIARGSVAVFIAKKSNGVWLEHPCTIDYTNNKVIYTFQESTVSSTGTLECEIHLTKATSIMNEDGTTEVVYEDLTTATFVIAVHDTILSGLDDSTEESSLLPELITKGTSLFTTLEQETIPNANTATDNANLSASNADAAAERANEATAYADIATANANEATARVNEATEKANTATENAERVTREAVSATTEANEATNNANNLISNVQNKLDKGEFKGESATHSWNGTTLTITSASGTSSADLKGETGEKGDKGDQGEKGDTVAPMLLLAEAGTNGVGMTSASVELFKKYKIVVGENKLPQLDINIPIVGSYKTFGIYGIGFNGEYDAVKHIVVEILDIVDKNGDGLTFEVIAEVNGTRKVVKTETSDTAITLDLSSATMSISYFSKLYLYDDNITIEGLRGEKGDKGDQGIQGEKGEKGDRGDGTIVTVGGEVQATWDADTKLDKITTGNQYVTKLYAVTGDTQTSRSIGTDVSLTYGGNIPQYFSPATTFNAPANACLISAEPTQATHVATKNYVDNTALLKVAPQAGTFKLYAVGPLGQAMMTVGTNDGNMPQYYNPTYTDNPSDSKVVGVLATANPIRGIHCANKNYVDTKTALYKTRIQIDDNGTICQLFVNTHKEITESEISFGELCQLLSSTGDSYDGANTFLFEHLLLDGKLEFISAIEYSNVDDDGTIAILYQVGATYGIHDIHIDATCTITCIKI